MSERLLEDQLATALRDLLNVIAVDELIPESVSYMKQARQAMRDYELSILRSRGEIA